MTKGNFIWVWGYDEISWFANQTKQLSRATGCITPGIGCGRLTPNGYLEMPGSRTAIFATDHNAGISPTHPSPAVP